MEVIIDFYKCGDIWKSLKDMSVEEIRQHEEARKGRVFYNHLTGKNMSYDEVIKDIFSNVHGNAEKTNENEYTWTYTPNEMFADWEQQNKKDPPFPVKIKVEGYSGIMGSMGKLSSDFKSKVMDEVVKAIIEAIESDEDFTTSSSNFTRR